MKDFFKEWKSRFIREVIAANVTIQNLYNLQNKLIAKLLTLLQLNRQTPLYNLHVYIAPKG